MDPELELIHQSIHAEYRDALDAAQWNLAKANAQLAAKDRIIAELRAQLDASPPPAE